MKKKLLAVLRFSFFLGIGIFFIWLFLRNLTTDQKQEIVKAFKIANYWWIAIAIVLGLLSHWVRAMRWRTLIEPMGYSPGKGNIYMAVLVGYLANLALPRLGEVTRCGILTQYEKIPFNKSFGTVVTERIIDFLTFILLLFFLILTQSGKINYYVQQKIYEPLQAKFNLELSYQSSMLWLVIMGLAILIVLFLVFHKRYQTSKIYLKFKSLLSGFVTGLSSLTKIKKPVKFLIYTFLLWTFYLLMAYVVFFSLPETASLKLDAGLAVLVLGSIGIMIVQGGIGIYPAIVAETLFLYSIPSTTGYAMGWLIWASQNVMILVAGLFSLLLLNVLNNKGNDDIATNAAKNTEQSDAREGVRELERSEK